MKLDIRKGDMVEVNEGGKNVIVDVEDVQDNVVVYAGGCTLFKFVRKVMRKRGDAVYIVYRRVV